MFDQLFSIKFEYPYILLVLVIFIVCGKFCKAKNRSLYLPHLNIYQKTNRARGSFVLILKWISIIFAIIALASPVKELNIINTKKDGIDIVLALDTSGSMKQIGFNQQNIGQNRWMVVKDIVNDFITKRVNDNIAIVVFGTQVMTASPLTYDKKAQKKILKNLNIGIVGEKTALINSVATSINILKEQKAKSKIIIVVTDGEDTASIIPLSVVIKMAKKYNIKIYTIAIGSTNLDTLQQLSKSTNGKLFQAYTKDDLKNIYQQIDKLEKTKIDQNKIILKDYLFFYPLFISFLSLLFFVYLQNKREYI